MLQVIDGTPLYIVDLQKVPRPNVQGAGIEKPYADALNAAIIKGIITKPGKYGIYLDWVDGKVDYTIYAIIEE
jgi:hypothetical protein